MGSAITAIRAQIFIVVGIAIMWAGGSRIYTDANVLINGDIYTAQVVGFHTTRGERRNSSTRYYLEFTYKTDEGRVNSGALEVDESDYAKFKRGDHVDIQILESEPDHVIQVGDYNGVGFGLAMIGAGVLFVSISTWRLVRIWRRW